ncbi:MAG TPA: hypothetical protein ENG51_10575 [Deltaproteobacteria bacterium]|nr:hypothetical protein [Deltaproteobacteria bacterium]
MSATLGWTLIFGQGKEFVTTIRGATMPRNGYARFKARVRLEASRRDISINEIYGIHPPAGEGLEKGIFGEEASCLSEGQRRHSSSKGA